MRDKIIVAYNNTQWFTDREAWALFRLAAFGEAIGWTLLITGVLFDRYGWPGHASVLLIAGRLHGVFFLVYIVAALVLSKSLGFGKRLTVLAAMVSVPPYGSLVLEQWLAYHRRSKSRLADRQITVRAIIFDKGKLLAVQPKDRAFWCLPGGTIAAGETLEQALSRLLIALTGQPPRIGTLVYSHDYAHGPKNRLEFFFTVTNPKDYAVVDLAKTMHGKIELDEIRFINPKQTDLRPAFLKTENLKSLLNQSHAAVNYR